MGEATNQPFQRPSQPAQETRVFSTLASIIYPVVAIVYSGVRASATGQDTFSLPSENCVGADCKIKGADNLGFYLAAWFLLPLLVSLSIRILDSLDKFLASQGQGTLFEGLWRGAKKSLELFELVWVLILTFGGAAILTVELVARGRIPPAFNWFGYAITAYYTVYWVWSFRSLARLRSRQRTEELKRYPGAPP